MLRSKASEDWVTWTTFWLLDARTTWWSDLVKLARAENP